MTDRLLPATVETPDGVGLLGPHGVGPGARFRASTSSGVYLIEDAGEGLLVDTGRRIASGPDFWDAIRRLIDGRDVDIRAVFLTHFHFDHVGHAASIADRYGAQVFCHPADRPVIEDPLLLSRPEYIESCGGDHTSVAAELGIAPDAVLPDADLVAQHWNHPVDIDSTVEDGDVIPVGDAAVEVLHTPGHTPGHCSLYAPDTGSLYLGDVDYWSSPLFPHPVGRADDQARSVDRCRELGAKFILPGHGLPRSGSADVEEYFDDLDRRARLLSKRLRTVLSRCGPCTVTDCRVEAFPVPPRETYAVEGRYRSLENCVQSHLQRLEIDGEVKRIAPAADGEPVRWRLPDATPD